MDKEQSDNEVPVADLVEDNDGILGNEDAEAIATPIGKTATA